MSVSNLLYEINTPPNQSNYYGGRLIPVILSGVFVWVFYFRVLIRTLKAQTNTLAGIAQFIIFSLIYMTVQILAFACVYKYTGLKFPENTQDSENLIYFSAITWTTVGYGDIVPIGASKLVAAIEALWGYIYMGIFIGILSSLLIGFKNREAKQDQ